MKITRINGLVAAATAKGVMREVSLFMLQDELPAVGAYVMVHVGYAIQTMTEAEAQSAWELYDEMLAAEAAQADA